MKPLYSEDWIALPAEQKMETLRAFVQCVAFDQGLDEGIAVVTYTFDDLRTMAEYNDSSRTIHLSAAALQEEGAKALCGHLLHELRHCYQHRLVDQYEAGLKHPDQSTQTLSEDQQEAARIYQQEFKNYYELTKDDAQYYHLACETDARAFSEENTLSYLYSIWKLKQSEAGAEPVEDSEFLRLLAAD